MENGVFSQSKKTGLPIVSLLGKQQEIINLRWRCFLIKNVELIVFGYIGRSNYGMVSKEGTIRLR
jgi:hypothetical protein